MDNRLAYDNSIMEMLSPASLLSDPFFHIENQRQISLRHLQRLNRLQADSRFASAQEQEQAVRMTMARLAEDLKSLAEMIDLLRVGSTSKRTYWRWTLPLRYVLAFAGRIV